MTDDRMSSTIPRFRPDGVEAPPEVMGHQAPTYQRTSNRRFELGDLYGRTPPSSSKRKLFSQRCNSVVRFGRNRLFVVVQRQVPRARTTGSLAGPECEHGF